MDSIATLNDKDRAEIFQEAANRRGTLPQIIEKDFWVCWTLKQLFQLPDFGEHLIFKGGTPLSKIFGAIERFSEDIDISIDRTYLGFEGEKDPARQNSKKGQRRLIDELKQVCQEIIRDSLHPSLQESMKLVIGDGNWQIIFEEDDQDQQTLLFEYPRDRSEKDLLSIDYVKPSVKIEFGARADHWPAKKYLITPYAAELLPKLFTQPTCTIKVLEAERTFWEKVTLLHAEYHRPEDSQSPERLSRHYYDIYQLMNTDILTKALSDLSLLDQVVEHKKSFSVVRVLNTMKREKVRFTFYHQTTGCNP